MLEITIHSLSAVLIVMFMVGVGFLFGKLGYIKKEHKGLMIKLIISAGMPALDYIRTFPHGKADYCWICYDRENTVARKLYLSFGFEEIGEDAEGDIDAVMKL